MRRIVCSALAPLAMVLASTVALAGEPPPILDLIALLPEDPTTYQSVPLFAYVDFRAVEAAAGVPTPESEAVFAGLTDDGRAPWQDGLKRIVAGPQSILQYAARAGLHGKTSYDAVGPDWFTIDRAMAVWQVPPHAVTLLGGGEDMTDPQGFEFTLSSRGFVNEDIDGVSVWSRFGDNAVAGSLTDDAIEGDIFDDGLMTSLRLAVLPGQLIGSRTWPDLRAMLDTARGDAGPAAVARLLRPMVEALPAVEGGYGAIVQAMAFTLLAAGAAGGADDLIASVLDGGDIDVEALIATAAPPSSGPALPPYPIVLLADIAAGKDQINVVALPFGDRATAETAARVLSERLGSWQPGTMEKSLLDTIKGTVSTAVVDDERVAPALIETFRGVILAAAAANGTLPDGAAAEPTRQIPAVAPGGAVALVAVRYPLPETASDERPSAFLAVALQAIYQRDFTPLSVP